MADSHKKMELSGEEYGRLHGIVEPICQKLAGCNFQAILTAQDRSILELMIKEIAGKYTNESITASGIYGEISAALTRDDRHRDDLYLKACDIRANDLLRKNESEGLAPEEQAELSVLCKEIVEMTPH